MAKKVSEASTERGWFHPRGTHCPHYFRGTSSVCGRVQALGPFVRRETRPRDCPKCVRMLLAEKAWREETAAEVKP